MITKAPFLYSLFTCAFLIFGTIPDTHAQKKPNFVKRYINKVFNDTTDPSKPQLLIYPTLAYSPETTWEFGFSSLYVFFAKRDTSNRLSEINGFTFYTLENQFGIFFDHAFYSHRNKWFFLGKIKVQSYPLLYYGIGPKAPSEYNALVEANLIQIKERVLRKVYHNLYVGLEMDFQRLSKVDFESRPGAVYQLPLGAMGSTNFGLGSGIIYDNRHNVLNVRKGLFSELAMLRYDKFWGSDYSFTTIVSDNRLFTPINRRDVLAIQLAGQFNLGKPPFNQLALLGGENLMRGYYLGRYRDNNLLAAQIEYRFLPLPLPFSKRIGAVLFAGTGTVFDRIQNFKLSNFVVSGGSGLRFLLFPKKDIFTRLDLAFTSEGTGFYIFIGEAF